MTMTDEEFIDIELEDNEFVDRLWTHVNEINMITKIKGRENFCGVYLENGKSFTVNTPYENMKNIVLKKKIESIKNSSAEKHG